MWRKRRNAAKLQKEVAGDKREVAGDIMRRVIRWHYWEGVIVVAVEQKLELIRFVTMTPMPANRPYSKRPTVVRRVVPAPAYGSYTPIPLARPARYPRRGGGLGAFLQGGLIGFSGGAIVMGLLALTLLIVAPAQRTNVLLLGLDKRP